MTFGKLRFAEWFIYDKFSFNVYIKADKEELLLSLFLDKLISEEECDNPDLLSMEEVIEKWNKAINELKHREFEKIAGEWYENLTLGENSDNIWSGEYDHKKVECIDIKNFKLPSIFLK